MSIKENFFKTKGVITKKLKNANFLVKCENEKVVTANIGSRFRNNYGGRRAKVIEGDKVIVEITLSDLEKGQIVGFSN
jgi:translation initiation factor IF-1